MCSAMIKGSMSAVLEAAVEAKIKKADGFVENGIFSIFDRTEHCSFISYLPHQCTAINTKHPWKVRIAKGIMLLNC